MGFAQNSWVGANQKFKTVPWQQLERQHHNRVRTPEEQRLLLEALVKKDRKRRSKILAVGIDYDYPEIVSF
jgi:nucleolar protein 15